MTDKEKKGDTISEEVNKAKITFSGNNLETMQKTTNHLVENAKAIDVVLRGPVRLPTRKLRIHCRRTPCGQGSKTWDNLEMKIYKRYIEVKCPVSAIKNITNFVIPQGIEINVEFHKNA